MDWTDDAILRLRKMWDDGLSTAEIGRRFGISKNAVVGKAHRLVLPPRPSPIRRDQGVPAAPREELPPRVSGPTLPTLSEPTSIIALPVARPQGLSAVPPRPADRPAMPPSRASLAAAMAAPIRLVPRTPACCWPIGEPGTADFHFCGEPASLNKPYCQPHAEIAYVRVRDRREDVA